MGSRNRFVSWSCSWSWSWALVYFVAATFFGHLQRLCSIVAAWRARENAIVTPSLYTSKRYICISVCVCVRSVSERGNQHFVVNTGALKWKRKEHKKTKRNTIGFRMLYCQLESWLTNSIQRPENPFRQRSLVLECFMRHCLC